MSDNAQRYPSNNHVGKEAAVERSEPRLKKVVKGEAKLRKPLGRRVLETFSGDDAHTVGQYVLFDVLIPSIKDMVVDAGKEALERAFFGSSSPRSARSRAGSSFSYGTNNRTSYGSRYSPARNAEEERYERSRSNRSASMRGREEIVLPTRADAEEALDAMRMAIDEYDSVSVADVYDFAGLDHDDYMDRQWGWTDLREASIKRLRSDEYLLDLPRTVRLP